MPVTRGFTGRRRDGAEAERLPPGQYLTTDFPVLTAGPTPHTSLERWTMSLRTNAELLAQWSWDEFEALPQTELKTDIHCVTKWSKFDTTWRGVSFDDLIAAAKLERSPTLFVTARADGGYTTNIPVADLVGAKAMVATHFEGLPLLPAHGGPARLLVPHLYFWKSAKWVRSLHFTESDTPGFWEERGYHMYGDPWREQRYDGDA